MPPPIPQRSTLGVLRNLLNISAAEMALRTGISKGTIHAIEGMHRPMTASIAQRIGVAFMVDPTWLTDGLLDAPVRDIDGIPLSAGTLPEWKSDFASRVCDACEKLINRSRRDPRGWEVPVAVFLALKNIVTEFYPEELSTLLPSQMTGSPPPTEMPTKQVSSRPARKSRRTSQK